MKLKIYNEEVNVTDIVNASYLTESEKAFILGCYGKKLPVRDNPHTSKQKSIKYNETVVEAPLYRKRWYETEADFIKRAVREGFADVYNVAYESKEVEREVTTVSKFSNGERLVDTTKYVF